MRREVHTADGRVLAVEDAGDPSGWPVLFHHGTPSGRRSALWEPWVADATDRGMRLISYDRPGYGESTHQPGRMVTDSATDVRTICADLGIARMETWGFSGGGQHALACAALLPGLVTSAASIAGLAPFDAEGLDWLAGKVPDDIKDTDLILTDEVAARKELDAIRDGFLAAGPDEDEPDVDDADLQLGSVEFREFMKPCSQAALAPGSQGWWDDNVSQRRPWGFDVGAICVPVLVMHGRQDDFVPFAHGEWLAAHIPGAETRWFDEYGHGSLAEHRIPDVHAWLAGHR